MISFMTYAVFVALLLGLAARLGERVLGQLDWPRRGIWVAALALSSFLPAKALLTADTPASSAILSIPRVLAGQSDTAPSMLSSEVAALTRSPWLHWLQWPEWSGFEDVLVAIWISCSAVIVIGFALVWLTVHRRIRRLDRTRIDGHEVYVSDRLGPAVFGFFKPRIVMPGWLVQNATLRGLVLRHECEHIASRDQLLLLSALLLTAAAPWNLGLWLQLRRLRAAIEVDCDARVLRQGTDAVSYSEALLSVRQKLSSIPLGAVALGEPVSELERRIRIMVERTQFRLSSFAGRLTLAMSLGILACAVNAPAQEKVSRLQPVWQEFLPAINPHTGSITANDDGLPVLTLVYDGAGRHLETDVRRFAGLEYPLLASDGTERSAVKEFSREMALMMVHAAAVFERHGQPVGEPIFFRSPFDASEALLIVASGDFIEGTMAQHEREAVELGATTEQVPVVKVAPEYPSEAAALGLSGYVLVEFTVTNTGSTRDIEVMDASSPIFEENAIRSAEKYKYKPRMEDGAYVETRGVRTLIVFGDAEGQDLPAIASDALETVVARPREEG